MKHVYTLSLLAAITLPQAASAQFVKGNEAVKTTSAGARTVETPPIPSRSVKRRPLCKPGEGCNAGMWHMVETDAGLQECTESFARPGSCRKSTYGHEKLSRVWVVKSGTKWLWCQYPDLNSGCVDMHARPPANLPTAALQ